MARRPQPMQRTTQAARTGRRDETSPARRGAWVPGDAQRAGENSLVEKAWTGAVCLLGGDHEVAAAAVLTIAAGARDVVYDGHPGDDERRSASWARHWLARAGVGESHVTRVGALVLATAAHSASPDDLAAWRTGLARCRCGRMARASLPAHSGV